MHPVSIAEKALEFISSSKGITLRSISIPEMIYTLILAVFLYRLISWINKKIEIKGSEKRIDKKII